MVFICDTSTRHWRQTTSLQRWQIILCAWKREITLPQILQFSASLLTILYLILIVSFYQNPVE
ncbi:MAG TPA: hypothetical protein DC040_07125 [Deltaproteobacteria bacterium]|nr:hypothetical protein [Deltaproteobacteria bacterium]